MNRLFIVMHRNKENDLELLLKMTESLRRFGFRYGLEEWVTRKHPQLLAEDLLSVSDCEGVISLGGDGTFLQAAAIALRENLPLFGVNIGRIGFLTEMDLSDFESILPALSENKYVISDRMILEAAIGSNVFYALNDVVVGRGVYAKSIDLDVAVNGENLGRFIADGYIVSTPTGSTGYAISAGGPIVSPELDCMVLIPICAHSLQNRAVMVPPNQTVSISMHGRVNYQAAVYCDGRNPEYLSSEQSLYISASQKKVHIMRFHEPRFFRLVQAKLN